MLNLTTINSEWTLFLDRDGVLNHEKKEDYIRNWGEFEFYPDTLKAIALLNQCFGTILVVTNQKGVGKELMTEADLHSIHQPMLTQIEAAGGLIKKVYYCTDLSDDSPNRKPQSGMAFQAQADFPTIDFSKSIMVGNRMSDMKFGRNAGMFTIFLSTTHPDTPFPDASIDLRFKSLYHVALACNPTIIL